MKSCCLSETTKGARARRRLNYKRRFSVEKRIEDQLAVFFIEKVIFLKTFYFILSFFSNSCP
jgi:hypothetical protein